jgi:RsiW-degrading membrane proteinase PrsW (M82 family)
LAQLADTRPQARWAPRWWLVFIIGLVLWLATIGAGVLTGDIILLPTIVLLGSFLVPVTAVIWYLDHDSSPELSPRRVISGFMVAGVLGIIGASVLEYFLLSAGLLGNLEVGLIEELVKGVLIVFMAWGITNFHLRDGMVLGATVGFGFAALESSGYALASLFVVYQHHLYLSLDSVVVTELVRGLLAPFGHGAWSGFLGGVMFAVARHRGHIRLSWGVFGAYLLVSLLHAIFDSLNSIGGYVVMAIVAVIPLVILWRRGRREDIGTAASYFR